MREFKRSIAVILGVDKYGNSIPTLRTAVSDATTLAGLLKNEHGYEVWLRCNEDVSLERITELLNEELPARVSSSDRLLFYFAGHGIAINGDEGPVGYLIPQDAYREDPATFLRMTDLHDALNALPCRHLLVLLDCCFAGAFRWSSTRHFQPLPVVIHRERYDRYLIDAAWQVITSAAHNQEARDVLAGAPIGVRGDGQEHSPFARALFDALRGEGDLVPAAMNGRPAGDGVITATELSMFLRERVELESLKLDTGALRQRQTPGLWMLNKHRGGEYLFLVPNHPLNLPPAPQLSQDDNPYRGLNPYEERHREVFFGREQAIEELVVKVVEQPLTAVLGASGTGKSSLVKAGLMPRLRVAQGWHVLPEMRPGTAPLQKLCNLLRSDEESGASPDAEINAASQSRASIVALIGSWCAARPEARLLLVVDQFEELITVCRDDEAAEFQKQLAEALRTYAGRFSIVITIRSDFEPHFTGASAKLSWDEKARFVVTPLTREELQEVVEKPAEARVLYFNPPELVEQLIDEVMQMPGALPLLSFTLSEMYLKYISRQSDDRALTEEDYIELGGVVGSLRHRATDEYEKLDEARRKTMRAVLLRMVAVEGREVTRRRVPKRELSYENPDENKRVAEIIKQLSGARLITEGREAEGEPYAEPAHDALVTGWDQLRRWIKEEQDTLLLQRRLTQAADDWSVDHAVGRLWDGDPRLPQAKQMLEEPGVRLNELEARFVRKSFGQQTWRRRQRIVLVTLAFIATVTAASVFYRQRNTAISQRFISLAQALAAESGLQQRQNRQDERAALLARQAYLFNQRYKGGVLSQVDSSLRAVLGVDNFSNILDGTPATQQSVRAVVFSPDGRWLAAGSDNGPVLLWDMTKPGVAPLELNAHEKLINALAFSPDSRKLASASLDKTVRLWDVNRPDGVPQTLSGYKGSVTCLAFNRDGGRLASGSSDSTIRIWDMNRLEDEPTVLSGFEGTPGAVTFSPDGRRLACGTNDSPLKPSGVRAGKVWAWDLNAKPAKLSGSHAHNSGVVALKFGQDNRTLVIVGTVTKPAAWDTIEPQQYTLLAGVVLETIASGAFSAGGMKLAMGSEGGVVRVWDLMGSPNVMLIGHRAEANSVAFSPDGNFVASAGDDDIIRLWNLNPPLSAPKRLADKAFRQLSVAFEGDQRFLLSGDSDGVIRRWEWGQSKATSEALNDFDPSVTAVAFSQDGKFFAASDALQFPPGFFEVHVVNREQPGTAPVTLNGHNDEVRAIAFVPGSQLVATGSLDHTVRLWDLQQPQPSASPVILPRHKGGVTALAISPDGKLLASGDTDKTIRLWNLRDLQSPPVVIEGHSAGVVSLSFSADNRFLASGSEDHTARVWDLNAMNNAPLVLRGHDLTIRTVAFSPDNQMLVTGSYDGTTRLWNLNRPDTAPVILNSGNDEVMSVAFSPDGKNVASGYMSGKILVWNTSTESLADAVCQRVRRNLNKAEWQQFIGLDVPYEPTCQNLPPAD